MRTVEGKYYYIAIGLWLVLVFLGAGAGKNIGNIKYLVMEGESMIPQIPPKALVVVRQQDSYQVGEIITFYAQIQGAETIVAHRIAAIGGNTYITSGDSNPAWDAVPVLPRLIAGKVVLVINHLGWLIALTTDKYWRWLTVVIPVVLVIINELWKIKKEIKNEPANRC